MSPNRGHLACLRTCSCSFGKSLGGRHPIRGKKDPPTTLLNVPPQAGSRIHLAGEGGEFTTTDVRLKPGVSEVASDNVVDTTGAGDAFNAGVVGCRIKLLSLCPFCCRLAWWALGQRLKWRRPHYTWKCSRRFISSIDFWPTGSVPQLDHAPSAKSQYQCTQSVLILEITPLPIGLAMGIESPKIQPNGQQKEYFMHHQRGSPSRWRARSLRGEGTRHTNQPRRPETTPPR